MPADQTPGNEWPSRPAGSEEDLARIVEWLQGQRALTVKPSRRPTTYIRMVGCVLLCKLRNVRIGIGKELKTVQQIRLHCDKLLSSLDKLDIPEALAETGLGHNLHHAHHRDLFAAIARLRSDAGMLVDAYGALIGKETDDLRLGTGGDPTLWLAWNAQRLIVEFASDGDATAERIERLAQKIWRWATGDSHSSATLKKCAFRVTDQLRSRPQYSGQPSREDKEGLLSN